MTRLPFEMFLGLRYLKPKRTFVSVITLISLSGVTALIREGVGHAIRTLWVVTMHALVAWLALGIAALAILYAVLVLLVRRLWRRTQPNVSSPYGC